MKTVQMDFETYEKERDLWNREGQRTMASAIASYIRRGELYSFEKTVEMLEVQDELRKYYERKEVKNV